jgi:hypothetical protein
MSISSSERLQSAPTDNGESHPEEVTVTVLNTRFGSALKHPATLDKLLPVDSTRGLGVVGFSEVTPGVRDAAVKSIEDRGYTALVPQGEGSKLDTVWAVSPGLTVDAERTITRPFPGRAASRPGKRQKRDAGTHVIEFITPEGHRVRAGTERYAPPLRGKRARLKHLGHMATFLDETNKADKEILRDPAIAVDYHGGDHQHPNGPGDVDRELWESRGFQSALTERSPTYNIEAAGKAAKAIGRIARLLGRSPSMQFDEAYLRAGSDQELVPGGGKLKPGQIGHETEVVPVSDTDHHAVKTTLRWPPKS